MSWRTLAENLLMLTRTLRGSAWIGTVWEKRLPSCRTNGAHSKKTPASSMKATTSKSISKKPWVKRRFGGLSAKTKSLRMSLKLSRTRDSNQRSCSTSKKSNLTHTWETTSATSMTTKDSGSSSTNSETKKRARFPNSIDWRSFSTAGSTSWTTSATSKLPTWRTSYLSLKSVTRAMKNAPTQSWSSRRRLLRSGRKSTATRLPTTTEASSRFKLRTGIFLTSKFISLLHLCC